MLSTGFGVHQSTLGALQGARAGLPGLCADLLPTVFEG